ncbi:hypothetical protein NYO99_11890 [Pelomonas sp. UHG3]|uniref:Uncharacterized protein n=1 Tax=Roseateles hydrophilus TaxID=2975054 RepID=A0ACC6CB80_9BURK|nr:hypothetical protein [Pelomonas sp. UHG3]MCY4745675.1 hypothetical protein [Pelomonas sp. UHG3]
MPFAHHQPLSGSGAQLTAPRTLVVPPNGRLVAISVSSARSNDGQQTLPNCHRQGYDRFQWQKLTFSYCHKDSPASSVALRPEQSGVPLQAAFISIRMLRLVQLRLSGAANFNSPDTFEQGAIGRIEQAQT